MRCIGMDNPEVAAGCDAGHRSRPPRGRNRRELVPNDAEDRRNTSSVRLSRTVGSSGLCRSSCCSMAFACSSMEGSAFLRRTATTVRQPSEGRVIVFIV